MTNLKLIQTYTHLSIMRYSLDNTVMNTCTSSEKSNFSFTHSKTFLIIYRLTQTVLFSSIIYGTICGQFDFLKDIVRQVQDEFPNKFDGIVEKIKDNGVYTKVTDGFDNLERFNKELNEKELRNQRFIETSYDNLLRNLNLWYPNFSAFNSKIKEFLKSVSAHEQNFFHQMVSERKAFEQYATSYIEEFAKLHGNVITEALYQQIRNILAYEFQFDIVEVERKLSRIIESGNVTSSDLVYEISKLKMIVEPIVSEIAFNKLEGSLQLWYPNLKKLNELLLSFLNTKKINPKLIEDMSADQQSFKTNLKTHSSEFSEIHRRVIVEEVFKQIKKFLIENYADQSERHQQIILDFRRNPEIDDSYTVDLLYDVTKLRNKLKPSIDSKLQNIALNNLENRLSTWYPHLNNFNSLLIQFMSMTNIRTKTLDEMSVNKFNFKLQANQTFFQFSKVYRRQIIFEIYGQIKIILQTDFRKEANRHDAILEELKSSRAIDITYKADLLYDMAKLKEKVTPTVNRTIQKLDINEAYAKLKNNLETWLPNNRNFSRNFIEFSKSKFTIVTTIKSLLESKEAFFSTKNQLLLKYSTEQRAVLQQDVYEQVEALLTEMNKWNPSKVNQDMEKLRRSSIEIKFTPQMLINKKDLSLLVGSILFERFPKVLDFHRRCV